MNQRVIALAIALAAAGAVAHDRGTAGDDGKSRALDGSWAALERVVDVIGSPRPADPNRLPQLGNSSTGQPASPYARDQEQARQPAAPIGVQPPAPLSGCNAGGCWDSQGNRYNATGDGSRFLNSDGKLCIATGKFITCN